MARTKTGSKGSGYEFWSKRPGRWHGGSGPFSKRITHHAERAEGKAVIRQALTEE